MIDMSQDEITSLIKQARVIYMEEDMVDISPAQEGWLLWVFELETNQMAHGLLDAAIEFVFWFVSESTKIRMDAVMDKSHGEGWMARVVDPTTELLDNVDVFLAGTIEMGNSPDWQSAVIERLADMDIVVANPRRESFDDFSKKELHHQINWELDHLHKASYVFMYLHPGTISPISLLELGVCLAKGKTVVLVCPDGYNRKDNVVLTVQHHWTSSESCILFECIDKATEFLCSMINTKKEK